MEHLRRQRLGEKRAPIGPPELQDFQRDGRSDGRRRAGGRGESGHGREVGIGRHREVRHRMPVPEAVGGQEEILQRAAQAQVQLPAVGVDHAQPPRRVRPQQHGVPLDREAPGLRIARGRRQHRVAQEKPELVSDRKGSGNRFLGDPQVLRPHRTCHIPPRSWTSKVQNRKEEWPATGEVPLKCR